MRLSKARLQNSLGIVNYIAVSWCKINKKCKRQLSIDQMSGPGHKNVIIAGYFDRHNLGDDLFHEIWKHIFTKEKLKSHNVKFIGLDDLRLCSDLTNCDVLIFAGGMFATITFFQS